MKPKQKKIPKTYRLPEHTIEGIEKIKESFLKDNMELSSDGAVISYAVGAALGLCKDVDDGYIPMSLTKDDIQLLIEWYKNSSNKNDEKSKELKEKLNWYIETSP